MSHKNINILFSRASWIRTNEIQGSKPCALPLGDSPGCLPRGTAAFSSGWRTDWRNHFVIRPSGGYRDSNPGPSEPQSDALTSCAIPTMFLYRRFFALKKRVMGIEPTYLAWKASVLPLNYTRTHIGVTGFEPATPWSQTRCSSQAEPHPGSFACSPTERKRFYHK